MFHALEHSADLVLPGDSGRDHVAELGQFDTDGLPAPYTGASAILFVVVMPCTTLDSCPRKSARNLARASALDRHRHAMPPPMHRLASPFFASRRIISAAT